MWDPKMYHDRAQRCHFKSTTVQLKHTEKSTNAQPLSLDFIKHKRRFPNSMISNSGLRAYFGYE